MLLLMVIVCSLGVAYGVEISISSATTEPTRSPDFRSSYWGMTIAEVKSAEGDVEWKDFDVTNNALEYNATVLNMDASICFFFSSQDKLLRGGIWFYRNHTNEFLYYSDYTTVSTALESKYGKPYDHLEMWVDDRFDIYKNDQTQWGKAIVNGMLTLSTLWNTDNTEIMLAMMGDNYGVQFAIIYDDMNAASLTNTDGI